MRCPGSFPTCDTCNICAQRDTVGGHTHEAIDADFAVMSAYIHHVSEYVVTDVAHDVIGS